ncbi:hypothetical protein [Urbanus proteus nucleopolyhedrovirus]|uniref:Uncharacterized protein n=1 Tax=Urbanus proteus nucleopolyhedrovirus TaxID=1675866 RepID=A0A161CD09_9ABAC|nr:hypothetical protein [Urbanus proteus nucleopolyhedrovirus]AKR17351.1 hypothetical protein [Urbanus proteus nucleopolyhedrovirus]
MMSITESTFDSDDASDIFDDNHTIMLTYNEYFEMSKYIYIESRASNIHIYQNTISNKFEMFYKKFQTINMYKNYKIIVY